MKQPKARVVGRTNQCGECRTFLPVPKWAGKPTGRVRSDGSEDVERDVVVKCACGHYQEITMSVLRG
jgi:RNase P subunit RPR2